MTADASPSGRVIRLAGAQLGPNQRADTRAEVAARMIALMDQAHAADATFIVYPELALTTFFPRWHLEDRAQGDQWFETVMPNPDVQPLFDRARALGMAMNFGYAEKTCEGRHFNTAILVDATGKIVGKYRKIHLPGHDAFDSERSFQHLEKYYFEPGNLGFPVFEAFGGNIGMCICNDRRWPETYRVMGLQGVELIVLGYNTPSVNSQKPEEGPDQRMFQHRLSLQAAAYQNATWVVAVAKAGSEDGHHMIGGSVIVNPEGEIVAETQTEGDEVMLHDIDLDACAFGKSTIFNFARHRRPEHYRLITETTGAIQPSQALRDKLVEK